MRGNGLTVLRSLAALVLSAALLIGVPLLLVYVVGNPLPSTLPSVDELRILLTQTGQGFANLLISALAIIIWVVWAQLVVAFAIEVVATARHVETRRLAAFPGIQAVAARLVAAITLAFTLSAAPLLAPAVGALHFDSAPAVATVPVSEPALSLTEEAPVASLSLAEIASNDEITLVLTDHVELWDVADSAYGDGLSWKAIAHANAGLIDSNGATITAETVTLGPGTELRLPGDVDVSALGRFGTLHGLDSAAVTAVTGIDGRHLVEAGDSMWSVAESRVTESLDRTPTNGEISEYWTKVVAENQDVASGDADLIFPGDELRLPTSLPTSQAATPSAEHPVEADREAVAERASPPNLDMVIDGPTDNRNSVQGGAQDADVSASPEPHVDSVDSETAVLDQAQSQQEHLGNGHSNELIYLTGLVGASDGLDLDSGGDGLGARATRDDGAELPLSFGFTGLGAIMLSAGVAGALGRRRDRQRRTKPESHIAPAASTEAEAFEAALRQSSSHAQQTGTGEGWRMVSADAVAEARARGPLLLHTQDSGQLQAVTVTEESSATAERIVFGPDSPAAEDPVPAGTAVVPTSLLIGTDALGEAVLVDLDSAGQLAVVGAEHDVSAFIRTAILDLAVSDRADDLVVIAVDIASELGDLERVTHVASFAEAVAHARTSGHASPDSTTPIIALAAVNESGDSESIAALLAVGVSVVAPDLTTDLELQICGTAGTIMPAGTMVELVAYPDDDYLSVAELVEVTSPDASQHAAEGPTLEEAVDVVDASACRIEAGPIEVKVLGSVEVAGADSFSSLKAVDVVAYLAFHRNGADADQIKSWVWPAFQPPTDKAFANVMSRARTALGSGRDGDPYLSRAGADRTYRLSTEVTTDFDRFRAFVDQADQALDAAGTVAALKGALELIRGVPFTGGGASGFVWADNHVRAQVEFAIDEAVHRCADLALEIGDLATARWAALKGLELVPGCEQCFRRRFLVASAGQNRSELRRAMADLERSAAAELGEPEGVDHISSDLLELYHQLDQTLMASSR